MCQHNSKLPTLLKEPACVSTIVRWLLCFDNNNNEWILFFSKNQIKYLMSNYITYNYYYYLFISSYPNVMIPLCSDNLNLILFLDNCANHSSKFKFIYLLLLYIPLSLANTSERSAGSRVWCLGPFSGIYLRLRSSVCYRTSSLQPKYQTAGVSYTTLYDHSLLQPYSA